MISSRWIKNGITLLALLVLPATAVLAQEKAPAEDAPDVQDIVDGLTEELELTEDQQKDVTVALQELMIGLHHATEDSSAGDGEGASVITLVKAERETYKGKMKEILTKDQYKEYEALVDQTLTEMFNDLAGIKLLDLQPVLDLSDEQVEQLEPVMGKGMRSMLAVIIENADKKLRTPQKIKIGKKLKGIQSEMNSGMKKIMTEEQWAQYEAMKEAQKEAAES